MFQSGLGSQPFVLSGSGTLGWELVAANLLEARSDSQDPDVLVANTGYFSDSWKDCFEAFGLRVTNLASPELGGTISPEALTAALKANPSVKLVALTQVDTSTGVLNDIAALSRAAKAVNPSVLVAVDGVCSFGAETFKQEEWGVDAALTCSQKAIGVPPGLCILVLSPLAMETLSKRQSRIPSYYGSLRHWLPIMRAYEERRPSYFATPNVNLIRALKVSLDQLLSQGMEKRWARHAAISTAFKAALNALGLKQVPTASTHAANTLSAIYFPTGPHVKTEAILPTMLSEGVVAAGGLHKVRCSARTPHTAHCTDSNAAEKRREKGECGASFVAAAARGKREGGGPRERERASRVLSGFSCLLCSTDFAAALLSFSLSLSLLPPQDIKSSYFRVGHMSYSVMNSSENRDDVLRVVSAIEQGLQAAGVRIETHNSGVKAYKESLALASKL